MSGELLEEPSGLLASSFAGFEWDALRGYAATFASFTPGQFLVVDARHPNDEDAAGMAPYIQIINMGPDEYVIEVPGNNLLAPPFLLTDRQEDVLGHLGFAAPHPDCMYPDGENMWRCVFEFADVPAAAAICVLVLAEVFALPVVIGARVLDSGSVVAGVGPCLHALDRHGPG